MNRRLLALVASAWLAAGAASAEVRIVRDGAGQPRLDVRPVAAGIWTSRGIVDAAVVNPSGDALGDGYPAAATRNGKLLAAWVRPSSAGVVLLRADGLGLPSATVLPGADPTGVPIVTAVGENWLIAWSTLTGDPSVAVTVASADDDGVPEVVLPGRLVAVVPVGDAVHVLSYRSSTGELHVGTIVGLHVPVPVPVPITVALIDLRLAMHFPTPVPVPIHPSAGMHFPQPFPIPTTAAWTPCIEVRADDALVAWSASDHQVGSIVLDSLGVVDAARFVRGPSGSCTAVLNAASRGRE
jgi:hypothetical protein